MNNDVMSLAIPGSDGQGAHISKYVNAFTHTFQTVYNKVLSSPLLSSSLLSSPLLSSHRLRASERDGSLSRQPV